MNKIAGLFLFVFIAGIAGSIFLLGMLRSPDGVPQVRLKSGSADHLVPMWEVVGTGPNDVVHEFPTGTDCKVVTGPAYVDVAGTPLEYYKLTCNGVTGYVSSKWVKRY